MDAVEKAVMEAYLDAATRHEPGHACLRSAMEAWLALNPRAGPDVAAREVYGILHRLRLLEETAAGGAAPAAAAIRAYRKAAEIGLHPDNCLAQAVEVWLRDHPEADRASAERRVTLLLQQSPEGAT